MESTTVLSQYEIERGKPAPSKNHAIVQSNLIGLFFMQYRHLYRIMSELSITDVSGKEKVPDIAIYPTFAYEPLDDEIRMSDAPLGVIEILSPTQSISELLNKSVAYFEKGVKSYWLVLPALRTIYIFHHREDYSIFVKEDLLKDEVLGIELELKEVFK